ncbi:MAG TPA: hypothetical protein VHS31_05445 [Tepidisphaeraceae bacterium]|nr:hypothetical protein [Tepidisphaeraceae bacterium]
MIHLPDELRLFIALVANLFVFLAAFKFSRRITRQDWIGSSLDAFLIHYLVQYLAVCLPGLLGILCAESMLLIAILLAFAMLWATRKLRHDDAPLSTAPRFETFFCVGCLLFAIGYFASLIQSQYAAPLVGDDALTYHLPVAGYWLQTGRLGLYNTWFFNPANTYSPLAGSTFFTWLIAPIGADMLAQFGQMPALIFTFFAFLQLARALNVRLSIASLIAVAVLLSRPFIAEAILVKDDHFLAAFFLAAIAGCTSERLQDRLGPWRIGVAIGLFFATKYTAFLTAPLFLLAIDAPFRAHWKPRQWLTLAACGLALSLPWYLRNLILTASPLYPATITLGPFQIFKGLFIFDRSTEMRTLAGAWNALTGAEVYASLAPRLVALLTLAWLLAIVFTIKNTRRDPLTRLCLLGPVLGLTIFFLVSHAALIRYAYPSLLLLFAAAAMGIARLPLPKLPQLFLAAILTALAIWGGFNNKESLQNFILAGVIVCAVGLSLAPALRHSRVRVAVVSLAYLILAAAIFVYWHAIMDASRATAIVALQSQYQGNVPMWAYIADHVPPDAPLAYTNLVFTRPLMGFDYSRRVFYIPTRPGLQNYHDLPPGNAHITDQQIRPFIAQLLTDHPDQKLWLANILQSNAQYLLVGRQPILSDPPEHVFAESAPAHFHREFANESGTLYQIHR